MSETLPPIIGFDLDGTLVDSNPDLGHSINHALALAGRPPIEENATRRLIGGGAALMLRRAFDLTGGPLPEDEFALAHASQMAFYEAHIADNTRPYPGCIAALDVLAARGCRLAVVTNKIERFARLLLEQLDLTERFAVILGGDSLGPNRSKPAPDLLLAARERLGGGAMAYVGDSSFDVGAARAARMPVVLCAFGYNDRPTAELGADVVIDGYPELTPALSRLEMARVAED